MIDSWVAEGECWRLEGECEPALKARGATIELRLNWLDCLTFSDGDAFHWTKVDAQIVMAKPGLIQHLEHAESKKALRLYA